MRLPLPLSYLIAMVLFALAGNPLVAQLPTMDSAVVDSAPGAKVQIDVPTGGGGAAKFIILKAGGGTAESTAADVDVGTDQVFRVLFHNAGTSDAYQPQSGDEIYVEITLANGSKKVSNIIKVD